MSDRYKNLRTCGLVILFWTAIGIGLRFANLGEKSASSIEISTLGFSLGHGFLGVPLDRTISLETLLSPLQYDSKIHLGDVIDRLLSETNHPPFFFLLVHLWLKLFPHSNPLTNLWTARAFSALIGSISIPAMFALGWLAFRSRVVGYLCAALMAVSPFGIYLAQEARHYTLAVLWIVASVSCLVIAKLSDRQKKIPIWLVCVWILVNSLGIATHYLFSLVLAAEGLVIAGFWWKYLLAFKNSRGTWRIPFSSYWLRLYAVGLGTAIACLVWLPLSGKVSDSELTDWILTSYALSDFWEPIPRLLAWLITMVYLLPVEGTPTAVTVVSGVVMFIVLSLLCAAVIRGIKAQMVAFPSRLALVILCGFFLGAIAIFLAIIYGYGKDLSKAARYHFVYFPVFLTLLAAALAIHWQERKTSKTTRLAWLKTTGKPLVVLILLMGLLGSLTVVTNFGYRKSKQADLLASQIQMTSSVPVLVATGYKSHAELRILMALGIEFMRLKGRSQEAIAAPHFLILQNNNRRSIDTFLTLKERLEKLPRPLDLWAIDLEINRTSLESLNCYLDERSFPRYGYSYWLSHCQK
jgi:uncharacterized membrane protein